MIYQMRQYFQIRDDVFKWFNVPYWQARQRLQQADERINVYMNDLNSNFFLKFMPALSRVYWHETKLSRNIAVLRCVEAIRMYAANHQGKLPASLSEITHVPIPINPLTGQDFSYELLGDKAVIDCPASPPGRPKDALRYEITIRK